MSANLKCGGSLKGEKSIWVFEIIGIIDDVRGRSREIAQGGGTPGYVNLDTSRTGYNNKKI